MKIRDLIPLSFKALLVNKARSILTMLGIVIGIASVMLMVSVGQSAEKYLLSQIASFGSDLVFIASGSEEEMKGPPSTAVKQTLTAHDLEALKGLGWPKAVAGSVITYDMVSANATEKRTMVSGATPDEAVTFNVTVSKGRFLFETDIESRSRIAILGQDVAKKLFGEENPVGRAIRLSHQSFRVVGILAPAGTKFFSNLDDQVYIPYTTFFDLYNKNRLNFIAVKSGNVKPREAKRLIVTTLRETHNIDNPTNDLSKDDFHAATQEDTIERAGMITSVLQILLASIASISLFVAGIGIMNIMYVTVTERTREIGLRKAIGATRSDVLRQFLAEAILLTSVAGLAGIIFGFSLSWLAIKIILKFQGGWSFVIPWNGAVLGFGVSAAIGIIFGYFPARRAARLNAIEALRYE